MLDHLMVIVELYQGLGDHPGTSETPARTSKWTLRGSFQGAVLKKGPCRALFYEGPLKLASQVPFWAPFGGL